MNHGLYGINMQFLNNLSDLLMYQIRLTHLCHHFHHFFMERGKCHFEGYSCKVKNVFSLLFFSNNNNNNIFYTVKKKMTTYSALCARHCIRCLIGMISFNHHDLPHLFIHQIFEHLLYSRNYIQCWAK